MDLGRSAARQSLLSVVVVLSLAGLGATAPVLVTDGDAVGAMAPSDGVVRVVAEGCGWRRSGSGVLSDSGVVTNRHVVVNAAVVTIEHPDGSVERPDRYGWSTELDLAVLPTTKASSVPWSDLGGGVGQPVEVIGHPGGGPSQTRVGHVAAEVRGQIDPDPDRLWRLDVDVEPGSSGSGVFDESGALLGVVYAAALTDQSGLVMRANDIRAEVPLLRAGTLLNCDR